MVAVIAVAAAIFAHPVGLIVTAAQDSAFEMVQLVGCLKTAQYLEASKSLAKLVNQSLYLALLCKGGLELAMVSLIFNALVLLVSSHDAFKQGQRLEGCADFVMAAVRLGQCYCQLGQLRRQWEIEAAIKKMYVGELHEKWQFPSDHLPVGVEVNGVKIISWNVLNNAFMDWVIEKDSQGLKGFLISDLNQKVNDQGLTQRDCLILDMIDAMRANGQIIALQECGAPFIAALEARLSGDWHLIKSFETPQKDQDIILYDRAHLAYKDHEITTNSYPSVPNRPLQMAIFFT